MVKNTKGGNKSKGFARKLMNHTPSHSSIRLPQSNMEKFAIVTKLFGNMCDVLSLDNISFKCLIRGKFRGRNKRSSFISIGSIVLIGFRDFQSNSNITDLLEIYDSQQLPSLFSLPYDFSPFHLFLNNQHNNNTLQSSNDDLDILFLNNISSPTPPPQSLPQPIIDNINNHNENDIDFDDI